MPMSSNRFFPFMQDFASTGQVLMEGFFSFLKAFPLEAEGRPTPLEATVDSEQMADLHKSFLEQHRRLWRLMIDGQPLDAKSGVAEASLGDRRFSSPEWRSSPYFDYLRQAYLINSGFIRDLVELFPVSTDKSRERTRFLARQFIDALSPANFAATNPEFVSRALETKGQSITDGINNLIGDVAKGRISITDEAAFVIGENLATTPGSVVFENEIIQLIQYAPTTTKVAKRPLLIVPPCINKFYILDLQPENSFVRYAVEQGNTVFLVSWRNPGEGQAHLTWDDYLENGPLKAIDVVREITKVKEINALGWCVGGTILSSALAVLAARGEKKVASLSLLTTLLDYHKAGDLGVFVDESSIVAREAAMATGGLLRGSELSSVFSMLRPNDLVWNYVASNYLKGEKPRAFDLLYWNADSTNLPGPFACYYLRNLYLENGLRTPGQLEMCGERIDLGLIDMPNYIVATREDHIVPWQSAYLNTQLLSGEARFVLGASGHIAGVINPANKNKRSFWRSETSSADAEDWLASATEHKGSWWNDWSAWLRGFADGDRAAPKKPGNARHKVIEAAPGRYVKAKA